MSDEIGAKRSTAIWVALVTAAIGGVIASFAGLLLDNPPTPGVETPVVLFPGLFVIRGAIGAVIAVFAASLLMKPLRSVTWDRQRRP